MLQQTQVATVVAFFQRFIARFPDVDVLARATEQEVLAAWSGLGYYRRAKALHRAAKTISGELAGRFPDDVAGWMRLPGVGRYTAGAIVSIALNEKAPILDGNVMRVLSRWFAVHGDPRSGTTNRELWRLAGDILPDRSVSEFNQALMELGALVCTPRAPRCLVCPVRVHCVAHGLGRAEAFPELPAGRMSTRVSMAAAVIERRGQLLMFRRSRDAVMKDLWEFPGGECRGGETPRQAVAREARERYGLTLEPRRELAKVKHSIMNRRIDLYAFSADPPSDAIVDVTEGRWVARDELHLVPVSSMVPKLLNAIEGR
jgi:A/G-specific adenine glycosylase